MILRSPTDHPKMTRSHIPPKNFVCCIPNAVSQTSVNPKGMKQHRNMYNMNEMHFAVQSSVTIKCVPLFTAKDANNDNDKIMKIMDYNEK